MLLLHAREREHGLLLRLHDTAEDVSSAGLVWPRLAFGVLDIELLAGLVIEVRRDAAVEYGRWRLVRDTELRAFVVRLAGPRHVHHAHRAGGDAWFVECTGAGRAL